jgi:hypothetical protein
LKKTNVVDKKNELVIGKESEIVDKKNEAEIN